jgi:SAM-dependent methyltransferase
MDELARYQRARWSALADAGARFTQPWLDLDPASAQERLDPGGARLGDLQGKDVLCLAGGGGQQAAGFALLGATVTTLDLSAEQLDRDREAAHHYRVRIATEQGDMRDLTRFEDDAFDVVWHAYSLGFVPDASAVFREVSRVLRPAGSYVFMCANPFFTGIGTSDWTGDGYMVRLPYVEGAEVVYEDEDWVAGERAETVPPPKEYRHTLSALVAGLREVGFAIVAIDELTRNEGDLEPGSWAHLMSVAPPWLRFWCSS